MIRTPRYATLGQLLRCGVLFMTLLVMPALAASSTESNGQPTDPLAQATSAPGLAGFLDEQGQLALPAGFSGSLNPAGFELVSGKGEPPRFAPAAKGAIPGDARWTGFGGIPNGCNGAVRAIAVGSAGEIYLGGSFTLCGDTQANAIVRYASTTNTWHALGSGGGNGVNSSVFALAVSGGDLFVGGGFTLAGGVAANSIARWTGSAWQALGSGGGNGVGGFVLALAVSGGDLYVGGNFTQANVGAGIPVNNIARWNGSAWQALGSGGGNGVSGSVSALAVSGGDLFVGGFFSQANVGAGIPANNIARWSGGAWQALGSGGGNGVNSIVRALAVSGGDLWVGGDFTQANVGAAFPANRIARWNGSAWQVLGSGGGNGVNGPIRALAVSGGDLFVGGDFSSAGGVAANNIARWDGSAWHALGSGGGNGVNRAVRALAVSGGDLFVGGSFFEANVGAGIPASNIARWNGSAWQALGSGGGNGLSGTVSALAISGGDLFVGGEFGLAGGDSANFVARWNGSAWQALGSGGGNGVNNSVSALTVSGGDLFVGGSFTEANVGAAFPANRIARWNGSAWQALGSGGGNGVNNSISALAVSDGDLFVGGNFTQANVGADIPANRIARWNGSAWQALGSGGGNGVNNSVSALAVSGDDLFVGGNFIQANVGADIPVNNIARWDGSAWQALGSGVSGVVSALAVPALDTVYVGGTFGGAGGNVSSHIAYYGPEPLIFHDGFE